jgi:hypothetical protein
MAKHFDASNPQPSSYPKWWDAYVQESTSNMLPQLASEPELLDVIASPKGDIAVVWQPLSQDKLDSVMNVSGRETSVTYFKSMKTGDNMGWIKTSSITDESFAHSFGNDEYTPFRYRAWFSGQGYPGLSFAGYSGSRGDDDVPLDPDDKDAINSSVWLSIQKDFRSYTENAELPDAETIGADIATYTARIREDIARVRDFADPDAPYVASSRIDEELAGKGFGTALYVYTAKRLGLDSKVLRASDNQSDEAEALWARFEDRIPEHVGSMTKPTIMGLQTDLTLDFRQG